MLERQVCLHKEQPRAIVGSKPPRRDATVVAHARRSDQQACVQGHHREQHACIGSVGQRPKELLFVGAPGAKEVAQHAVSGFWVLKRKQNSDVDCCDRSVSAHSADAVRKTVVDHRDKGSEATRNDEAAQQLQHVCLPRTKHSQSHKVSSIDMSNNDVGKESAQKFMKQTDALKASTLYFAS